MLLQQTKALTMDTLTPRMHCNVRVYNAIVGLTRSQERLRGLGCDLGRWIC